MNTSQGMNMGYTGMMTKHRRTLKQKSSSCGYNHSGMVFIFVSFPIHMFPSLSLSLSPVRSLCISVALSLSCRYADDGFF